MLYERAVVQREKAAGDAVLAQRRFVDVVAYELDDKAVSVNLRRWCAGTLRRDNDALSLYNNCTLH